MNAKALFFSRAISSLVLALICFIFALRGAATVVFTNDTLINSFDTSYDGNDIVASNCTLKQAINAKQSTRRMAHSNLKPLQALASRRDVYYRSNKPP